MVSDRPPLAKGEMSVLRLLWELGEASVREVHESICGDQAMEFATVQTYLRRLETKGYVRASRKGRVCYYKPRAKAQSVIRETMQELVDRLFGGNAIPLVQHMIEEYDMSSEEMQRLRKLIDDKMPQGD